MHDAFSRSTSVQSVINRTGRSSPSQKFSPSFGVHRGLIKDPNWPPPQFPEHGTAASRRFRRVEAQFTVQHREALFKVTGDVSQGGAMFMLDARLEAKEVYVLVGNYHARAEVLSCSKKGNAYAHHCRFAEPTQAAQVWRVVSER